MTENCNDINCPSHGNLSTRGIVLEGKVVSDKMNGTVIIERIGYKKIAKYNRYKKQVSRIPAHKPSCMEVKVGDKVKIEECRKISKTVSFVVTEVMK